jgi:hypothetical protein
VITPGTRAPGSAKSGSRNPSQEAVLLALLKAETLELRKTLSSSSGGSARSSTTGSGAAGSSRGSSTATATGTGGGSGSGTRGSGASSSSASTGSSGAGSSTGSSAGSSSAGSSAQAILQTTSNQLLVTVDLDATKQSEAVVGEPVSVQLPSGATVGGRITQVSPIAQSSSSSSSSSSGSGAGSSAPSATIPVTIKIVGRHPVAGLDQAAVSVNFEQQVEKNVLSVPVTALLATAGGGYAVQEAGTPHRLLAVTPGLFAAGYVQVSGADIYSGLQVTDSQG